MKASQKLTLSINPLVIIIILLAIIIGMLGVWRPWEGSRAERTVTVTGTAELESVPDEFIFSPYFQRTGNDTAKLRAELNDYGRQLLDDITKLGIDKADVTLQSHNIDKPAIAPDYQGRTEGVALENSVTLWVTIKAPTKELAQRVQNYLGSTDAKGQLTAMPGFSGKKRAQLDAAARDKATKDARQRAETTAKNLGGTIGKVIKIDDNPSNGPVAPLYGAAEDSATTRSALPVTPGKEAINAHITVTFELR